MTRQFATPSLQESDLSNQSEFLPVRQNSQVTHEHISLLVHNAVSRQKLEQSHSIIFQHTREYNTTTDIYWIKAIQPRPTTECY